MTEKGQHNSRRLDTPGAVLFNSGSTPSFCCKAWTIKTLAGTELIASDDSTYHRALKLLEFINSGKITGPPAILRLLNEDKIEKAVWLAQLHRRTTHPELWVCLASSGKDEDGMEEFCRGRECFAKTYTQYLKFWKMEYLEVVRVKLACPVHDLAWDCDIFERKG